ncbi:MAG: FmdB family zinc ribbon protein [Chloroflexia bacterium]
MPIYEYRCPHCRGRFSVLALHPEQELPRCPRCGNTEVRRLISGFATLRSEEEQMEALADPSMLADVDENDPKSIARWARRMQRTMGEDLGEDFEEMIEEIESGRWKEEEEGEGRTDLGDEDLGWA